MEIDFNNTTTLFDVDSIVELGGTCKNIESLMFNLKHLSYLAEGTTINNPFNYRITDDNGVRYLEFTNNNDTALYTNQSLNIADNEFLATTVYPNPADDTLYVNTNNATIATINVYDALGKKVADFINVSTKNNALDVSGLVTGIYFLKITNDSGGTSVLKFIKE